MSQVGGYPSSRVTGTLALGISEHEKDREEHCQHLWDRCSGDVSLCASQKYNWTKFSLF